MNGLAEVIPIDSRRRRKKRGTPPPEAALTTQRRRRRLTGFLGILLAVVLALIIMDRTLLPHPQASAPVPLTVEIRQGLYQRALADLAAACTLPQARAGLLREHCVEQARFLHQLSECTGECSRLTRAVFEQR
jgi:hypothetical protein